MSYIAIMMFTILSFAILFGIFQFFKTKNQMLEDTSDVEPARKLQQMDQDAEDASVGGTKKDPRAA